MPFPVNNIRALCKEKGTTLAALEKKLGFGNGVIAGWETAKNWPPYDRLYAVATELGATVDELAGNNDNATPLSSIGANIVAAAGNINAARLTLHSLHIDDAGINAMLYGGYVWTDNALAQIAEALGCSVDALKKENAPAGAASKRVSKISDLSAKLTEAEQDILIAQIEGILRSR